MYRWEKGEHVSEVSQPGKVFTPLWQVSPADAGAVNVNLLSDPRVADIYATMLKTNSSILSHNTEIGDLVRDCWLIYKIESVYQSVLTLLVSLSARLPF
jgi:hypothetical protein